MDDGASSEVGAEADIGRTGKGYDMNVPIHFQLLSTNEPCEMPVLSALVSFTTRRIMQDTCIGNVWRVLVGASKVSRTRTLVAQDRYGTGSIMVN